MINRSYLSRRSCRSFDTTKPVPEEYYDELKTVINLSPTSTNSQGFSAIFVKDKQIKEIIKSINFDQPHIADADMIIIFCVDYNRSVIALKENGQDVHIDGINQFTINVVDCALAASAASAHANSLGLGACFLGGLRSNADKLVGPLKIEGKCLPVLFLAVGFPAAHGSIQPKINKCYDNAYDLEKIKKEVEQYDEEMRDYYKMAYNKDGLTWTKNVAKNTSKMPKPDFVEFIEKNFIKK